MLSEVISLSHIDHRNSIHYYIIGDSEVNPVMFAMFGLFYVKNQRMVIPLQSLTTVVQHDRLDG